MSFLITGANGLIGSDLVKILSKKSKVIAIYRKKRIKEINSKNITWVKRDLIKKLKLKYRPKYIINCVIDQSYKKDPKKYSIKEKETRNGLRLLIVLDKVYSVEELLVRLKDLIRN